MVLIFYSLEYTNAAINLRVESIQETAITMLKARTLVRHYINTLAIKGTNSLYIYTFIHSHYCTS